MEQVFPGHGYNEVVLALQYAMDHISNDPNIKNMVPSTILNRWPGTQDGAHSFLNFLNSRSGDVAFINAVRSSVLQSSCYYLVKSTATKPSQSPSQILTANRPKFVSAITGARTHSIILSYMPAVNSTSANNVTTLASREPDTAAQNLLSIVESQDLWGEFVIALTHSGHKNLADLFSGAVTPGAAPAPAPSTYSSPPPRAMPAHEDDGDVFQLRQAPEDMLKFIMVSLAQGNNMVVIPARKFPGGLKNQAVARQYLESVNDTNSPKNLYYGTKLGVYKRIFSTSSKAPKSKIVENAEFDSDSDEEAGASAGRKKKPSKTTVSVDDSAPAPGLQSFTVVRGGVSRVIQMDQGLPKYLIVARDASGLYEPVTPGKDEPGISKGQEAVDFAIKNKRVDRTSEYGVYLLGPSNVVEEEEVFMVSHTTLVEKRPVKAPARTGTAKAAPKASGKGSTPKASALPVPRDDSDGEDMSDK